MCVFRQLPQCCSSKQLLVEGLKWTTRRRSKGTGRKKKRKEEKMSFRRRHSTQLRKRKRGISGFFFFFKTRVGGREEHLISPQLTCARWAWLSAVHRLCHEFPQEEQNAFCTQHPGGQMKVFKGRTGRSRQVAAFIFYHSYITVAPLGHAGTRLPGTSLMSDCFSHPVFQPQMVSDYKETSERVTRLYECNGAENSDGTRYILLFSC